MDEIEGGEQASLLKERSSRLKSFAADRRVVLIFRLILAGFFILSASGKLVDIERYSVDAVYNFGDPSQVTIFMDIPMMVLALVTLFSVLEAGHGLAIGKFLPQRWREELRLIW